MSDVIKELYEVGVFRVGEFVLSSGIKSPFYINLKVLPSYPDLFKRVVELILKKFGSLINSSEFIVGVATGGIPIASYISCLSGKPLGYVRSTKKSYGLESSVEGNVSNKRVLLVDDVATTGGSLVNSSMALLENGAKIIGALVIVDREQGAEEKLREIGIDLYSLWKAKELFNYMFEEGLISFSEYKKILDYLNSFKK